MNTSIASRLNTTASQQAIPPESPAAANFANRKVKKLAVSMAIGIAAGIAATATSLYFDIKTNSPTKGLGLDSFYLLTAVPVTLLVYKTWEKIEQCIQNGPSFRAQALEENSEHPDTTPLHIL